MMEHDDDVILLPRMEDIDNCVVGDENILVAVDADIAAAAIVVVVAAVFPFAAVVVDEDDVFVVGVAVATTPHQHHPVVVNVSESDVWVAAPS